MHHFFAYMARMRFIDRWALMRNSYTENIQEHSHQVAILAHALAVLRNEYFGGQVDAGAVAVAALYHDASEILTGDMPTPIKYYNPDIRDAYKQVEAIACRKLTGMLPQRLQDIYAGLLTPADPEVEELVKAADKLFSHSKLDHTIFGFLRTTAKAVLIFIAVMLVAGTLGIDTSSLLAILSVAGLAVSLSMQTALSNVAGALMILTAKPFRSGDYVQIGDKAGTVLTIGAVYTSLRTYDNQIIYLPNSQITTGSIVNMTSEDVRRIDVNVSASYDDAADKVRAALCAAAAAHEKTLRDRPVEAHVVSYGDSSIQYVLRFWARTEDYWTCYNDVLDGMQEVFSAAGITMCYPHINVHMGS